MTKTTREELLAVIKVRYLKASHSEKTNILDEFCKSTGHNRKYAIRILQAKQAYRSGLRINNCSSAFFSKRIFSWLPLLLTHTEIADSAPMVNCDAPGILCRR